MPDGRCALVVFVAGGRRCALPTSAVREVVHYPELSVPPGTPGILEGFLNYGGDVLPVARLDRLFGLPQAAAGLYAPLMVLRETAGRLALLVDDVEAVVQVERARYMPVADDSVFNACVEAVVELGGEPVHVLIADRILLAQERLRLQQLGEMVERRLAELGDAPV